MSSKGEMALQVRGLSKVYSVSSGGRWWQSKRGEPFWALKDVGFEIRQGEVVGVIGRNGAGKSTLLKILTRITAPSAGEADLFGRVGSLLEVGTGFHPELTGRENIFLNGAILGMRRREIQSEFDAIVAFAGVEKFLDTPVKRYSSGMYVRLAFAVAAHLRSEILLVDEVLAVGDVEFQRKCLGKMRDVAQSGRTVLFVSHHLPSVSNLCSRALVMESGRLVFDGDVSPGVERYMAGFARENPLGLGGERRPGSGELRVTAAAPERAFYESAGCKCVRFTVEQRRAVSDRFFVSLHLVDSLGSVLLQCDSRLMGQWFEAREKMEIEFSFETPWLKPGTYRVDLFICSSGILDHCEQACSLEVLPVLPYPGAAGAEAVAHGAVFADFSFQERSSGEGSAGGESNREAYETAEC